MFTMILMLYLQQNMDVTLESTGLRGQYANRKECEAAAVRARGPLPIPKNYAAAWQDALCVPITSNARVNDTPPLEIARLLREQPAAGCQGEGTWRRLAEYCSADDKEVRD